MKSFLFLILTCKFLFLFSSCGVKTNVIAPKETHENIELNLDCSPKDPNCDAIDPNYVPSQSN